MIRHGAINLGCYFAQWGARAGHSEMYICIIAVHLGIVLASESLVGSGSFSAPRCPGAKVSRRQSLHVPAPRFPKIRSKLYSKVQRAHSKLIGIRDVPLQSCNHFMGKVVQFVFYHRHTSTPFRVPPGETAPSPRLPQGKTPSQVSSGLRLARLPPGSA